MDSLRYHRWALDIAGGDWIGKGVFFQAPLYPYFLGMIYSIFGESLLAARIVQIVIGSIGCGLLFLAAQRLFDRRAGWIAGLGMAVYPSGIFFDLQIQKTVLDVTLMIALLTAVSALPDRRRWHRWIATGAILGALSLTRENALIFFPVLLLWTMIYFRQSPPARRAAWAGLLLLGAAGILLPVAWRNHHVGGEFALTTSQFGMNFFIGNGRNATGMYAPLRAERASTEFEQLDATELATEAMGRELSSGEVSAYWRDRALEDIAERPMRWIGLMAKKCLLLWNAHEISDAEDQYTYSEWSVLLRRLTPLLHFGVLVPLAVAGTVLTWDQRKRLGALYAMILSFAASVAIFYVFARYRLPLAPMLMVIAAGGIMRAIDLWKRGKYRTFAPATGAAIAAAVIVNWPMLDVTPQRATNYYNLGVSLFHEGRFDDAARQFEAAIALHPTSQMHHQLGETLARLGQTDRAMEQFARAIALRPGNAEAHLELGLLQAQRGRSDAAIALFREAIRLDANYAEAHYNLGIALSQRGEARAAELHYRTAIRLNDRFAQPRINLGLLLTGRNRLDEAIAVYREALPLAPDSAILHNNLGVALGQQGRLAEALEHFKTAVRLDPDYADARRNREAVSGMLNEP